MTPEATTAELLIPRDIADAVIQPASYSNEQEISYPAMAWLRANNPFGVAEAEGFGPVWLATTHADIMQIERSPQIFTSGRGAPFISSLADEAFLQAMNQDKRGMDTLAYMDAPEHTKIKNVTSQWFLPANVRKREADIREIARSSVQKLLSFDGRCDFMKDVALYYPLRVIMSLFGVPPEDEPRMLSLTQEFFGNSDPEERRSDVEVTPDAAARQWEAALADFHAYFDRLAADRRDNPTDDLASIIANAKVDGDYLPNSFINGYYIAIATAGHDTTSSTMAGAIHALAQHPDQLKAVREDPSLIPSLVEEALRWVSPVKHFRRIVAEDTEFAGRSLKAGDSVMLLYPSANRDEVVFESPNQFDLTRKPNKHIAFGYGAHQCIGQHVAKLEMRIFLEELLPHLESIQLAGEPRYVAGNFLSGPKTLPITYTRA